MSEQQFESIYSKYYNDIYRLSYSYLLNKSDAEDVTQKCFYKMYKKWYKIPKSDIEVKKWLFRIAINESKDNLKSYKRKELLLDNDIDITDNKSNNSLLFESLKKIKVEYRITLYLYYYEGYSIKEIAKIFKKSESAIKMRLSRGKDELKMEMED